jgi:hypothetical protein
MSRSALRLLTVFVLAAGPFVASAQTFDRMNVYGTAGKSMTGWHGQAALQSINFEFGRAMRKHYDVAFVVAPTNVTQPVSWFGNAFGDGDEQVRAISGSLLVRRHWREMSSRASLYAELSSGPLWAEKRVPASTSRFNFISQGGFGFVLMPQRRLSLIVGYRLAHISNGGYAPRNPGLNVSEFVIGTRIRNASFH